MDIQFNLRGYLEDFQVAREQLSNDRVVERIWKKDYTLWSNSHDEITNRLGWLDVPQRMKSHVKRIRDFVDEIKSEGFKNVLLLGMGGSSLAPEVFSKMFTSETLKLKVLDSTHPAMVAKYAQEFNPEETLYLVSTKSGGTVETLSLMKYFYNFSIKKLGKIKAGKHFVAITDPGSKLENLAAELNFHETFLNDPNIGGRFSALSYFGLLPAALIGVDLNLLLERVEEKYGFSKNHKGESSEICGAEIGAALGALYKKGKDKLSFIAQGKLNAFSYWAEQLIAESTGKSKKGILPVLDENQQIINSYSRDRIAVVLRYSDVRTDPQIIELLEKRDVPIIEMVFEDEYDIAPAFFVWEFATAVAGYFLKIHPFNQPNVEATKAAAREMLEEYKLSQKLSEIDYCYEDENLKAVIDEKSKSNSLSFIIREFFGNRWEKVNPYVAIQFYVPYDSLIEEKVLEARTVLARRFGLVSTFGYGPRFLHSTGQLHKGDGRNGFCVQVVYVGDTDLPIPNEAGSDESDISFGVLLDAESLGDRVALMDAERKVLRIEVKKNLYGVLNEIIDVLHSIQF